MPIHVGKVFGRWRVVAGATKAAAAKNYSWVVKCSCPEQTVKTVRHDINEAPYKGDRD